MLVREIESGPVTVLEISGKIMGGREVKDFRQRVKSNVDSGHRQIIVDMEEVEWINSEGLGMLIGALLRVERSGGRLVIANAEPARKLLTQTRLMEVFDICSSREEAFAEFEAEAFE